MPVANEWIVERRLLLTRLTGQPTLAEFLQSAQVGTRMISEGIPPVFNIVDFSQMDKIDFNLTEVRKLATEMPTSDKLTWILMVAIPNKFVGFLVNTAAQLMRMNYVSLTSIPEAYEFISKRDSALKESLENMPVMPSHE